jgi:hypothetical protein
VLALALPSLVLVAVFLSPYLLHEHVVPLGSDTAQGIWRARVVSELGLDGLPPSGPTLLDASTERPGLPVTMALLQSVTGLDPFEQSFLLPAVLAIVIGLSAGALAVAALGEPRWTFPVYALLVGGSLNVELMAAGYFDNLFAAAVVVAACVTVLLAIDGRRGIGPSITLLSAAVLFHWMFAALFALVLVALLFVLLPASVRARRQGTPRWSTPAGRLGTILGGTAILGGVGLAATPNALAPAGGPARSEVLDKLGRIVPVGAALPSAVLAGLGAWKLDGTGRRRWGRILLLVWAGSAAFAAAIVVAGARLPAHRVVAFALAVPLLAAAGAVWFARLVTRLVTRLADGWRPIVALGVAGVIVAGGLAFTIASWTGRPAYVNDDRLAQIERIGAVVDGVAPGRPVVVVTDAPALPGYGATPAIRRIRAVVDPARVGDLHVFIGSPEDLLAHRPAVRPTDPGFETASAAVWRSSASLIGPDPVVLVSRLYYKDFDAEAARWPGERIGNGLLALGAGAPVSGQPSTPASPSSGFLVAGVLGLLLVLTLVGVGWSWTLLAARAAERVALAPAIGLAALAIGGVVADRLGVAIGSLGGLFVVSVLAVAGWAPVAWRRWGSGTTAAEGVERSARWRR